VDATLWVREPNRERAKIGRRSNLTGKTLLPVLRQLVTTY
jgi:hypothetical protein